MKVMKEADDFNCIQKWVHRYICSEKPQCYWLLKNMSLVFYITWANVWM